MKNKFRTKAVMWMVALSMIVQMLPFQSASANTDDVVSIRITSISIRPPLGDDLRLDRVFTLLDEEPNFEELFQNEDFRQLLQSSELRGLIEQLDQTGELRQLIEDLGLDVFVKSLLASFKFELQELLRSELEFRLQLDSEYADDSFVYPPQGTLPVQPNTVSSFTVDTRPFSINVPANESTVQIDIRAIEVDDLDGIIEKAIDRSINRVSTQGILRFLLQKPTKKTILRLILSQVARVGFKHVLKDEILQSDSIMLYRSENWGAGRSWVYGDDTFSDPLSFTFDVSVESGSGNSYSEPTLTLTPTPTPTSLQQSITIDKSRAYTNSTQWLYAGPDTSYPQLVVIPASTWVDVIESQKGWSRVWKAGAYDGWIDNMYLVFPEQSPPPQLITPTPIPAPIITPTPTPQPTVVLRPTVQPNPSAETYGWMISELRRTSGGNDYPTQTERFVENLLSHQAGVSAVQNSSNAGERTNALVDRVWDDWDDFKFNHWQEDPTRHGQKPLRQLVIRMVQGTQGPLSAQDQRALENFYSQQWTGDIRGMIAAVHREVYGVY